MPNKRSRRKTQHFNCCFCNQRLWRLGGRKYHLYYTDEGEIRRKGGLSRKSARMLANQGPYVDASSWIEEFFCGEHGKIWMLVTRQSDDTLVLTPAQSQDWSKTTQTIDPNTPNPSVSEYSFRFSRQADLRLTRYNS